MSYSIWLLTLTCLVGAGPDDRVVPVSANTSETVTPCDWQCEGSSHRFLGGLLHRRQRCCTPQTVCGCGAAPSVSTAAPALAEGATGQENTTIKPEYQQRVAIAEDASWVIGQLFYLHADGGTWMVRYAGLDREDRYGGGFALAAGQDMTSFKEGDLVYIHGEIIKDSRASKYVAAPLYRPFAIQLSERSTERPAE
jgi:hypothetical protein